MFKKFSYLASVSILASVIMATSCYAVTEDELGEVILNFKAQKIESIAKEKEEKEKATLKDQEGWGSYFAGYASATMKPVGKVLRWGGDKVRGEDNFVGDLLAEKGTEFAKHIGGASASAVIDQVHGNEGAFSAARQSFGNGMRWFGACFVEETPTLERALRNYWIQEKETDNPDEVFTTTACALYLNSHEIGGVAGVKKSYRRFIKAWNSSDWTVKNKDVDKIHESFLKGLIRGFVRERMQTDNLEEIMKANLVAYSIDLEHLPVTKAITDTTVLNKDEKKENVTPGDLKNRISGARQVALLEFVKQIYSTEKLTFEIDERNKARKNSRLLIEDAPGSSPRLIEGPRQTEDDGEVKPSQEKEKESEKGKEKDKSNSDKEESETGQSQSTLNDIES